VKNLSAPDSYPSDSIPPGFGQDVAREVARLLGATYSPECKSSSTTIIRWRWEALKYYTYLFHEEWIDYVSREIARSFNSRPKCIWGEEQPPDTIILYYK
jgi:hypothetical protein